MRLSINIYTKEGTLRCVASAIEYNGSWREECYVLTDIDSPVPVGFEIGDWLEYRGERFEINYDPEVAKQCAVDTNGVAFRYEGVKLNSLADELTRCDFLDYTLNDNGIHFSGLPVCSFYCASVADFAYRIQANLDRLYKGERKWTVEVHPEYASATDINISIDTKNVWNALCENASKFGVNYIIRGRHITIGTAGLPLGHLFKMGAGNGLKKLTRTADTDQQVITRLRVYGSTRNLPHRYYNSLTDADGVRMIPDNMAVSNLMLPGFPEDTLDPYLDSDNIEALGVREGSVFFDGHDEQHPEVFPSIEEMTADQLTSAGIATTAEGRLDEIVSSEQVTDNGVGTVEGSEIIPDSETFEITVKDWGFDINEVWTDETPQISFRSGKLGGRDFEIVKEGQAKPRQNADKTWTLTLKRVYDESIKLFFPYSSYNAEEGDRFVLLHIYMPQVYIKAASQRLKEHGSAFLSKNDYSRSSYSPEIDEVMMAEQHRMAILSNGVIPSLHDTIKEGDLMVFEDSDLGIGGADGSASIFIDHLTIKEGYGPIPTYEVTLREEKAVGTLEKIQNQIDSIKGGQGSGGYNAAQIKQLVALYGLELFLSKDRDDRTPYALSVGGRLTAEDVLASKQFMAGLMGWRIDRQGNMEVESGIFRSFAQFAEIIANRLSAIEGDTLLTESDTIEQVTDHGDGTYTLHLHEKWEGYFTAQIENNVCKGIYNNITQGMTPGPGQHQANNALYYTSWFRVLTVNAAAGTVDVVMYPDAEVPAGRNFPPAPMMRFARWGNSGSPDIKRYADRQQVLYLSSAEGRVVKHYHVTKPIVDEGNVAMTVGTLPEFVTAALGLPDDEDGGYFKTLVTDNLIVRDHQGRPKPTLRFRGPFDSGADYYAGDAVNPDFGDYELSVTELCGCQWLCSLTGTHNPPSWLSTDWTFYLGDPSFRLAMSGGPAAINPRKFSFTLVVTASKYGQDVTADILPQDIVWTRYSEDASGNPRVASDNIWALRRAGAGLSLPLTEADLDAGTGIPPVCIFTCSATLRDGTQATATYNVKK